MKSLEREWISERKKTEVRKDDELYGLFYRPNRNVANIHKIEKKNITRITRKTSGRRRRFLNVVNRSRVHVDVKNWRFMVEDGKHFDCYSKDDTLIIYDALFL